MGESLRYNLEHMGDVLFDKISHACGKVKGSTRGIKLTYKIGELQQEKAKLTKRIGKRVVIVRDGKPEFDLSTDKRLVLLFKKLDDVQKQIDDCLLERKKRLYPDE
jgi:hypothetical protein